MRKMLKKTSLVHMLGFIEGIGINSQKPTFLSMEPALFPQHPVPESMPLSAG